MEVIVPFIIIAVVIILAAIYSIWRDSSREKAIRKMWERQDHTLLENGVTKSADLMWSNRSGTMCHRIVVDDVAKKVYVSSEVENEAFEELSYEDVIGFEVIEDSHVTGGIKRAVVGGILAGGAGAIVGAQTAYRQAISSMSAVIYLKNVTNPQYIMELIVDKTRTDEPEYLSAKDFTGRVYATIKAIMAINDD